MGYKSLSNREFINSVLTVQRKIENGEQLYQGLSPIFIRSHRSMYSIKKCYQIVKCFFLIIHLVRSKKLRSKKCKVFYGSKNDFEQVDNPHRLWSVLKKTKLVKVEASLLDMVEYENFALAFDQVIEKLAYEDT